MMKTGQVAQALDVDAKTILNWTDHPVLNKFFSDGARGAKGNLQRVFSQQDLLILNTVRVARSRQPANRPDWNAIAGAIENGELTNALPLSAYTADTGITEMDRVQTSLSLQVKLDSALEKITEYKRAIDERDQRIRELEKKDADWNERFYTETARLREEKAAFEARYAVLMELLSAGRLSPKE
jgi:hypothetical protein